MSSQLEQTSQSYVTDMVNSDIEYRTKQGETPEEMNSRIRDSIRVKFNKILLREEQKELFNVWEKEVATYPLLLHESNCMELLLRIVFTLLVFKNNIKNI